MSGSVCIIFSRYLLLCVYLVKSWSTNGGVLRLEPNSAQNVALNFLRIVITKHCTILIPQLAFYSVLD